MSDATPTEPGAVAPTPMADYEHPAIEHLIESRGWRAQSECERIRAAYTFVKDEIAFGYNASDRLPASAVLADRYGQCNTKSTLLFALLAALRLQVRFHGAAIDKALQAGAIPAPLQGIAPQRIMHSWVEVRLKGDWVGLEGVILDAAYLGAVQSSGPPGAFCGYGIATSDLADPEVSWAGRPTWIQREGIAEDFGVYATPDCFWDERGENLRGVQRLLYRWVVRHWLNRTVARVRRDGLPAARRLRVTEGQTVECGRE